MPTLPDIPRPIRIDLHCHSIASNRPAEALLKFIHCPECYSDPAAVHAQATARGMNFVTITDHDSIAGVLQIADRANVLVGQELTAWFPEDGCKMHILLWGITSADHEQLQQLARNIYDVADYLETRSIAHAVAHPIYRQNDKLERWHLERLTLLFKGFECLNGAHSPLHRQAFEPLLDQLTPTEIERLSAQHHLRPRWPDPHKKSRTAGSDDHGLLNIGQTWTEFPPGTATVADFLDHLRNGRCAPNGQSGSAIKLAHTFYSVALNYYFTDLFPRNQSPTGFTRLLHRLTGQPPRKRRFLSSILHPLSSILSLPSSILHPLSSLFKPKPKTLRDLFLASVKSHLPQHPQFIAALRAGLPPLGDHDTLFHLISLINRDITAALTDGIKNSIDSASYIGLFDTISALLGQQFALLPYYFALFHQNKERRLLRSLTGQIPHPTASTLRVALFTDTLDESNGVSRFLRDLSSNATQNHWDLTILTCSANPTRSLPIRKNFAPIRSWPLPYYADLPLNLPPILDILQFAESRQFDVIHISTPGPMGLLGLLASRMLRAPCLATYHTDFPAYAHDLTADHRIVHGATLYVRWFYQQMATVFARSREYRSSLQSFGLSPQKLALIQPASNPLLFNPNQADPSLWQNRSIKEPHRLLYVGRLSQEKNLLLLATAFRSLCSKRKDVALVLAGDGPLRRELQADLAGLPAYFLGHQDDPTLAALYASSTLFLFPSRTDTLGQAVLEALSSGLPALVSNEGGPQELVEDDITGRVLSPIDPEAWSTAIAHLLDDPQKRRQMFAAALERTAKLSQHRTFDQFWSHHLAALGETNRAPNPSPFSPPAFSLQSPP